jgi:hypothetical protein
MSDPALALQKAVRDTLAGSAAVTAIVGARIYDRVANAEFPYVTIGNDQLIDDGNACGDAWECFVTVDAWSRGVGMTEVKSLAAAVRSALATELAVTGFSVVAGVHQTTRYLDDPDGLTSHAVVTFRYLIDPT